MLRPTKHSHPDRTIVGAALVLMSLLKKRRVEDYSKLSLLIKKCISGGDYLFLPALNLLFLLGLIEYSAKTDAIEYTGPAK